MLRIVEDVRAGLQIGTARAFVAGVRRLTGVQLQRLETVRSQG